VIVTIQFRRGTTAQWGEANPILSRGEPGLDQTLGQLKIGDGVTRWDVLDWATFSQDQMAQLIELLESGTSVNDGMMSAVLVDDSSNFTTELAALMGSSGNPVGDSLLATIDDRATSHRAASPVAVGASRTATDSEFPRVRKPRASALFTKAQQAATTIYWASLVDLSLGGGSGIAGLYSTDHVVDHNLSGVFMVWWPNVTALLNDEPTFLGRIYRDDVSGYQTETPSVVWDPATELWRLFYQQATVSGAVGVQSTLQATSSDFGSVGNPKGTWTRVGIALDIDASIPGDGHTGYAKFYEFEGQKRATSLCGGGDDGASAWWVTDDWVTFKWDGFAPRSVERLAQLSGYEPEDDWTFTRPTILHWRGQPWAMTTASPATSGAETITRQLVTGRMATDLRTMVSAAIDITPTLDGWESEQLDQFGIPAYLDGRIFVPYRVGGASGAFGLLEVY
jgi:hypothetical protein